MNKPFNWLVHDRNFEAILSECVLAAGAGMWEIAVQLFHSFVTEINFHMRMEDELFYSLYVEKHGDPDGEIADLRQEHDSIIALLRDLNHVIKRNDFDHFEDSLSPLYNALAQHIEHEEEVLEEEVLLVKESDNLRIRRDEFISRLNTPQTN